MGYRRCKAKMNRGDSARDSTSSIVQLIDRNVGPLQPKMKRTNISEASNRRGGSVKFVVPDPPCFDGRAPLRASHTREKQRLPALRKLAKYCIALLSIASCILPTNDRQNARARLVCIAQ